MVISDGELDEALNCVLNASLRTLEHSDWRHGIQCKTNDVISFSRALLGRGASLLFRDLYEHKSSLEAIVELAIPWSRYGFLLSNFSPYICCPLTFEADLWDHHPENGGVWWGHTRLLSDNFRLASLFCLAARRIPRFKNESLIDRKRTLFVGAHQASASRLGVRRAPGGFYSWTTNPVRLVACR